MSNKAYRVTLEREEKEEYSKSILAIGSSLEQVVKRFPTAINIAQMSFSEEVVILRDAPKKKRSKKTSTQVRETGIFNSQPVTIKTKTPKGAVVSVTSGETTT